MNVAHNRHEIDDAVVAVEPHILQLFEVGFVWKRVLFVCGGTVCLYDAVAGGNGHPNCGPRVANRKACVEPDSLCREAWIHFVVIKLGSVNIGVV